MKRDWGFSPERAIDEGSIPFTRSKIDQPFFFILAMAEAAFQTPAVLLARRCLQPGKELRHAHERKIR
jgi:hypothetical protein